MQQWMVQIGPDLVGAAEGLVNSTAASFLVSLGKGNPAISYAEVSWDDGGSWTPLSNDEVFEAKGSSAIQWRYRAPPGVSFKFLIGPASS